MLNALDHMLVPMPFGHPSPVGRRGTLTPFTTAGVALQAARPAQNTKHNSLKPAAVSQRAPRVGTGTSPRKENSTVTAVETPEIGTIEIVETDEFQVPDEMRAHLYGGFFSANRTALCGIKNSDDPHNCMHERYGENPGRAKPGDNTCPLCGAKLCESCEQIFKARTSK